MFKKSSGDFVLNKIKKVSLAKEKYLLLVDNETCNDDKIILDFSYNIVNAKTGQIVEKNTYIIKETWETPTLRNGIYSKDKVKDYRSMLKSNKATLITKQHLYYKLNYLIKHYGVNIFIAYNGVFDLESLYNTFDYTNKRMKQWQHKCWRNLANKPLFLKLDLLDLWTYASKYYRTKSFKNWYDKAIGVYGATGNRKTTAEIMARYLKENAVFQEAHKGLEDLEIEYSIFMACVWKSPNKIVLLNYIGLWGVWKLAQDVKIQKDSNLYQKVVLCNLD